MSDDYSGPIVGTAYYRPPSPPLEEWEPDFKQMRAMGFEAVKMWLYWGWHERRPGKFDWSESDRFFDLAEQNGLWVVPNIILELPPSWFKPHHVLQSFKGPVERAHFPSIYVPCFDDRFIRRKAEPFLAALVRRYRHRHILHWDAWNEPRSKGTCICDASRKLYARWLQEQFTNIENYNRVFGKCFHNWDAVTRHLKSSADYADEFNWRLWAAEQLADQVHWVARIVKKNDPQHPVICHVGISSPVQNVRYDTCVDALMMDGLDFYGSSYDVSWESQAYLTDKENVRGLDGQCQLTRARIQVDWLRSLSPRNWICELYANLYHPWATRQPEMLLWQFWQAVVRGLGGIMIWEYKVERIGIESLGYGLVGLDGKPNERSKALSVAMRLIKTELAGFFREFVFQEPTVGILYDERSHLLSEFDGYYNSQLHAIYQRSFWSLYETLRRRNIPVRLVPHQHLDSVLPLLTTFILPGHGFMDAVLAAKLIRFVENGGHLIGQAGVGFRQENTWISTVIPSHGLNTIFGVREASRTLLPQAVPILDANRQPMDKLAGFRVSLDPCGATPLARFEDGAVALVSHTFGRGKTHYLGGFLGLENPDAGRLLDVLGVSAAKDNPLSQLADLGLDVIPWQRKIESSGRSNAWFIFNATGQSIAFPRPPTALNRTTMLFGEMRSQKEKIQLDPNSAVLMW